MNKTKTTTTNQLQRNIEALNMTVWDFVKYYGDERARFISQGTEDWLKRLDDGAADKIDYLRRLAAKHALLNHQEYLELQAEGLTDVGTYIKSAKECWEDIKWKLQNTAVFITIGTLRMVWEDKLNLEENAKTNFGVEDPNIKWGQRRTVVSEHPQPSAVMKEKFLAEDINNWREAGRFIMNTNFISCTTALEDKWFSDPTREFNMDSNTPEWRNPFARYDAAGIKTFKVARTDLYIFNKSKMNWKKMSQEVRDAKANGSTFGEWAATMIEV